MKALNAYNISNISEIISKRISLLITNNSNLKVTKDLYQDTINQFDLMFKNIPALVFDNNGANLVTSSNLDNIYEALSPYQASAQKYALGSLNSNQYNLLELSKIGASYMILLFINDHYKALFTFYFEYFYDGDDLEWADDKDNNSQREEIAAQIHDNLSSRIHYVIK
jgi:hypothetical protein